MNYPTHRHQAEDISNSTLQGRRVLKAVTAKQQRDIIGIEQADWDTTDTDAASYIKHKPKLTPYEFTQSIPLSTWTVNHNLGYKPNSIEVEVSGEVIWTRHDHVDVNTFTVSFAANNSGVVRYW